MQKYDVGARNPGTYEKWIEDEGVPVHEALIGVASPSSDHALTSVDLYKS